MVARAQIVDGPYPPDTGPGLLLRLGGLSTGGIYTDYWLARLDDVDTISLASLRTAIARRVSRWEREPLLYPDETHRVAIAVLRSDNEVFYRERYDHEIFHVVDDVFEDIPMRTVVFVENGQISVAFSRPRDKEPNTREVEAQLRPFLIRHDAAANVSTEPLDAWLAPGFNLKVKIQRKFPRSSTLGDAWRLGEDAAALIEVVEGDEVPRAMTVDLLRSGRWGVFKGQPESDWLEAKGAPYAEANTRLGENWKYELAKDVAAFANSPEGGIIVIGMTTRDGGDGEVITGFKEFDLKRVSATSYGNYIAQHVYPRVDGFEVLRVSGREHGRGIAALVIPPQDPSNFPFLVRGMVKDRQVLGNHVLWPVRQGGQTAILDADGLHTRLRLGDQAIKGQGTVRSV